MCTAETNDSKNKDITVNKRAKSYLQVGADDPFRTNH